ncbi:reprolysin-like metallopeptidase [uncultured Olleya sp.]|uniref:reprolysin-like metallopeptidase n=1 Tax=uncultured Olleya sp. TaxID=757243 RepID=UPI0025970C7C|nr:zinc-dependent metalloprotease family protein [uncultured Olleya sp.]
MKQIYLKQLILFVFTISFVMTTYAQKDNNFWQSITKDKLVDSELNIRKSEPIKSEFFSLNVNALKTYLSGAPKRFETSISESKFISFPTSNGEFETYNIMEASILEPALQNKYDDIKTYVGQSISNSVNTIRFSITPQGLHTISFNEDVGMEYIDPYTKDGDNYIVYAKKDLPVLNQNWTCDFEDDSVANERSYNDDAIFNANDGVMREFRLALACTIEYSEFHWMAAGIPVTATEATKKAAVLAAMVVTMNRNNFVYERDLSVTMTLVANNENIIFIDSDNFSNDNASLLIVESHNQITSIIGSSNFDIGHTFSTGGGGLASLNSPCNTNSKGRGITGLPTPVGDAYDIDFVAHELGHQFGAPHTFNGDSGNCSGSNRSASNAYEPGSGSTIMAYAGICAPQNVQSNSDAYFHQKSLQMIWDNITTGASQCASQTNTGNSAPTAEAGSNFLIPKSTPFKLTGSSTDADGVASHTYTWEQYDLGSAGLPNETNTTGPLVRSYEGTSNPTRYIPRLEDIVANGSVSTTWEKLASVGRNENFRLTVRDNDPNGGQTAVDNMIATVDDTDGPFLVTSQNTDQIVWTGGSTETITWDVAGTNVAPGVATPNVNILLSIDNGQSFNTVLASNVPNNGSYDITVPNVSAPYCRIMVEGAGNIFFNLNEKSFAIGNYTYVQGDQNCEDYTFNAGVAIPESSTSYTGYVLNIPDNVVIEDLDINVNFTTADNSDLFYAIRGPWQTDEIQALASGICSLAVNTDLTFDDEGVAVDCSSTDNGDNVLPQTPLSFADGQNSSGDWVFFVTDVTEDGTTSTWNSVTITICSGGDLTPVLSVENFDLEDQFSLYPNPNSGDFTIKFNDVSGDVNVEVFDMRGRRILQNTYDNVSSQFDKSLSLGDVQSGIYLLNVKNNGRTITKKIVVE